MSVKDRIVKIVEWARDNEITVSAMYDIRDYHDRFCRCKVVIDTAIDFYNKWYN